MPKTLPKLRGRVGPQYLDANPNQLLSPQMQVAMDARSHRSKEDHRFVRRRGEKGIPSLLETCSHFFKLLWSRAKLASSVITAASDINEGSIGETKGRCRTCVIEDLGHSV